MQPIFLCWILLAAPAAQPLPAADVYEISNTDSTVRFEITKWMILREEGRFRDMRGNILWDPLRPESSSIEVSIQTGTLDTGNSTRDETVRSEDFLWVERHPEMTFKSTHVERLSEHEFSVTGEITIRGETRSLTVPVSFLGTREVDNFGRLIAFQTHFQIDRTDYGVLGTRWSGGRMILGNEVDVFLTITGISR